MEQSAACMEITIIRYRRFIANLPASDLTRKHFGSHHYLNAALTAARSGVGGICAACSAASGGAASFFHEAQACLPSERVRPPE